VAQALSLVNMLFFLQSVFVALPLHGWTRRVVCECLACRFAREKHSGDE